MFIKLRKRAQITLPTSIVKKFQLKEGDVLDCLTYEGEILLLPQDKEIPGHTHSKHMTFSYSIPPYIPAAGLYIQCFSHFCLYLDRKPIPMSKKAAELLALLTSEHGGPINKETAGALLWPDSRREQGLDNLLRLCRRIQKSPCKIPLNYDKKTVWLDISQISCDLYEFEKLYQEKGNPESCEAALSLYRGMIFYDDCYDWAVQKEAYYDMRYLALLSCMEDHMRLSGKEKSADIYHHYQEISE